MTANDPMSQRCTATSKQRGEQCKRNAIPGGTVCRYHGGAAPQVAKKAHERLMELQFPAIGAIEEAFGAEVKGEVDYGTRLRAATAVLDRTGLGPTTKQEVSLNASEQLAAALSALDG